MSVLRTGLIAAVVSIGLSAVNSGSMEPCGSLQGGFSGNYRELEQRNPWSNGGRNQWDNSTWSNPDPRQPYGGQRKRIPGYCIHTASQHHASLVTGSYSAGKILPSPTASLSLVLPGFEKLSTGDTMINTPSTWPVVPNEPVSHVVPLDITAPQPIQAPYTTPFATQSPTAAAESVAGSGQSLPPPWAPLTFPPVTPVGAALIPPGQRMPDPSSLVINSMPWWDKAVASDPYFTPIEVVQMAQEAGYLPPDWFQYNTPVISYETNRGDGRGDILSGYLGQGHGATPYTFYQGNNPYGY